MKRIFVLFSITILMLLAGMPKTAQAFIDTNNHWAAPLIEHLYTRGIIKGYNTNYYRPDMPVTREEFIVTLIKSIHKEDDAFSLQKGDATFIDTANTWGKGYIELARELDITEGDPQNRFNPKSRITREEAVTMLARCLSTKKLSNYNLPFHDNSKISSWAWGSIVSGWQYGLVSGYPDRSFRPQQNITRGETTALIENLLATKGDRFHFYGILQEINTVRLQANIIVNGKLEKFELAENIPFYSSTGHRVTELKLPSPAYFDVDESGSICYVYLTTTAAGAEVNLNITGLPSYLQNTVTADKSYTLSASTPNSASSTYEITNPSLSLEITSDAMQAQQFSEVTGATGRGQLVAVIDSGIDPGHPDLLKTNDGYRKIIDYIDLSGEGNVELGSYLANSGFVNLGDHELNVSDVPNLAKSYQIGYLKRSQLPGDFTSNYPPEKVLVVSVATKNPLLYDTIYIDTDNDGQIDDETSIGKYSLTGNYISIKNQASNPLNLVVCDLASKGDRVIFGYDCIGHGTQVAGIVAARGTINGIAPNAQLLPIKVVDQYGASSIDKIIQAINLAGDRGAKIAVLSLGKDSLSADEFNALSQAVQHAWQDHDMLICTANGNNGPGLGTSSAFASITDLLSVGAYATPDMWLNDYGYAVKEATLWYFSSIGPGAGGTISPQIVAPGSAVSTYPLWTGHPYLLDEGSSMAAPHVAGAAALLMDAMSHSLYKGDTHAAAATLLAGAEPLKGYVPAEQGFGVVNLIQSWEELKYTKTVPESLKLTETSPLIGDGDGLLLKGEFPAQNLIKICNTGKSSVNMSVGSLVSWMKPAQNQIAIPSQTERTLDLNYQNIASPGLYNGFLVLDDPTTIGFDSVAMQTVVLPYQLDQQESGIFRDADALYAGKYKRYYFNLNQGANLNILVSSLNKGKIRAFAISPDGAYYISAYAGIEKPDTDLQITQCVSGVWEVVVYASIDLSKQSLEYGSYALEVHSDPTENTPLIANDYLVTCFPTLAINQSAAVTIHFWNHITKQPINGMVSINHKMYELKNGSVEYSWPDEGLLTKIDVGI